MFRKVFGKIVMSTPSALNLIRSFILIPAFPLGRGQGRNEIRWRPRQEVSLAPPYLNLRTSGSKCTQLKKILVTLLGLFGALRSDLVPP